MLTTRAHCGSDTLAKLPRLGKRGCAAGSLYRHEAAESPVTAALKTALCVSGVRGKQSAAFLGTVGLCGGIVLRAEPTKADRRAHEGDIRKLSVG